MSRTLEYLAVTVLGLTLVVLVVYPIVEATAQSIINTSRCIEQPANCQ